MTLHPMHATRSWRRIEEGCAHPPANGNKRFWAGYRADRLRAWKNSYEGTSPGDEPTNTRTYFYYDGGLPVLECDSSGNVVNVNVFSPDGLVARKQGTTWRYYQFDPQGSVANRSYSSETVFQSATYDPYGKQVQIPGPNTPNEPFGWNGRWGYYNDLETGLTLCMHRYYDADQGRWLNRDPIGYRGGVNLYGYCGSGPIGKADPSGLSFRDWVDDTWVNVSEWWSGTDVVGPGGEPVRVGGWHAFFFNEGGNAMTVNGTVHLNDHEDYAKYINDKHWSDHERVHIFQEDEYHNGNAVGFFCIMVIQYIGAGGHDGAPYEVEAEAGTTDPSRLSYPTGLLRVNQP